MPFGPAPLTFIRQRFADAGALDEEIGVLRQVLRDRSIIAMRIKGQVNYWVPLAFVFVRIKGQVNYWVPLAFVFAMRIKGQVNYWVPLAFVFGLAVLFSRAAVNFAR